MNRIVLLAAGCCVLALSTGCESREEYRAKRAEREAVKTISKLDCPEAQGGLKRLSVAPDGKSCSYGGKDVEVTLRLVSFTGDPAEALKPIEAELRALMPPEPGAQAAPTPPQPAAAPGEPQATSKETVKLPGMTVETETGENVDRAHVRMPGIKIEADGDNAKVEVAGIKIEAKDNENEVRITRERWSEDEDNQLAVNASGGDVTVEGGKNSLRIGGGKKQGFRSTFIKSTDSVSSAFTGVGYEARGPKSGPLVVAVVKSRSKAQNGKSDSFFRDVGALVRHNVGG